VRLNEAELRVENCGLCGPHGYVRCDDATRRAFMVGVLFVVVK